MPPKYPAIIPKVTPISMTKNATKHPTAMATCIPCKILAKTLLPSISVPKQLVQLGDSQEAPTWLSHLAANQPHPTKSATNP